jgi:hypothetical protein
MGKPQQPELRRSGFTVLDPDSIASDIEARERPGDSASGGPVPEENQPGHRPETEQDKPSGDDFVARARAVADEAEHVGAAGDGADPGTGDATASAATDSSVPPTQTSAPTSDGPVEDPASGPRRDPFSVGVGLAARAASAPWRISADVIRGIRRGL